MMKKLSDLKPWDKNPREIDSKGLERLKKQIKNLGIYKPLLVNQDNIVLGGNMRLKAYQELGIDEVEVSVVDAQTEARMIEYALSDNDRAGKYLKKDLIDLLFGQDINQEDYSVDLGSQTSIEELLQKNKEENEKPEIEFTEELLEEHNYIVLYFDNQIDWLNLQTLYPLKTVQEKDSKPGYQRVGIGRVVRGVDFLEAIQK
jgi:hypothetical protein